MLTNNTQIEMLADPVMTETMIDAMTGVDDAALLPSLNSALVK